jgi:pimeloyl-ACP methyl ester carboxylesterase
MYCLRMVVVLLSLGGSLALVACGTHPTTAMCFGPRSVSSVHLVGSTISFVMTTKFGANTYYVPQSAFGGAPAAMKSGDIVAFCTKTVDSGGQSTTTITQFSDQGQPAATDTPQSR